MLKSLLYRIRINYVPPPKIDKRRDPSCNKKS